MKTTISCLLCVFVGWSSQALAQPDAKLAIRNDISRRTLTVTAGPLTLPSNVKYGGALVTVSEAAVQPIDGWVRSFEIELLDARGHRIREPLLHHAGLFSSAERDLFSPAMRRIVAFGRETEAIRLPGELGYRVARGDSILLLAALFNSSATPYDSLYLRITMVYADAARDIRHADILPLYLDVLPPGNREYDVPPGMSKRSWDWSPAVSGNVLALGGHLHRYGRALILEDVTTGDTIWVGSAKYDAHGDLIGIDRKIFWRGVPMYTSHVYRLTAVYDNPTGEVVTGAMGKIGGLFLPNSGHRMPSVDRSHPDYIRDLHAMLHHTHELDHVLAREQRVSSKDH
jgi:hypothetical protein